MLDRAHAGADRALDGFRRIGVGKHVTAKGLRLFDGGRDFVLRELQAVERVPRRGHAAGDEDLDLVCALAELFAHGLAHVAHAVGCLHQERQRVAALAGRLTCRPAAGVAVAAGHADGASRNEEAWAVNGAVFDSLPYAPVRAAGVPDGREATAQHVLEQLGRFRGHEGQRVVLELAHGEFHDEDVDVAVDEARHQSAAAEVDAGRGRGLQWRGGDLANGLALHDHVVAVARLVPARIQKLHVVEVVEHPKRLPVSGGHDPVGCRRTQGAGNRKGRVLPRPLSFADGEAITCSGRSSRDGSAVP